jgi:hypothetical protein
MASAAPNLSSSAQATETPPTSTQALCELLTAAYDLYEGDGVFAQTAANEAIQPLDLHDVNPLQRVKAFITSIEAVVKKFKFNYANDNKMILTCVAFEDDLGITKVCATTMLQS